MTERRKAALTEHQKAGRLGVGKFKAITRTHADSADDFVISVTNMTDLVLVYGCINYRGDGNDTWFSIPATPRTCPDADCRTCFDVGKYLPVLAIRCGGAPFKLALINEPEDDGDAMGGQWNVTPDCQEAGVVLCLEP